MWENWANSDMAHNQNCGLKWTILTAGICAFTVKCCFGQKVAISSEIWQCCSDEKCYATKKPLKSPWNWNQKLNILMEHIVVSYKLLLCTSLIFLIYVPSQYSIKI